MGKINLYFSIVKYDDMPIEMKYLNIVQALETYHARFKYNDLKKYKKHVLQLFRCKTIDEIDEKQRNAYFDVTQSDENITYIILKSRLVDLMNDDFRTPITPVYTNGKIIELYDFIEKVVDIIRKCFSWNTKIHNGTIPDNIFYMRYILNLICYFLQILILHSLNNYKRERACSKFIQKDILPFHRFNLSRQIGQNVIINSGFHIADRGWNQQ